MSLSRYHQKRDFVKTAEPKGKVKKAKTKQLLFVIQKHAASHLHYDFRLELDGVLKSWAVPKGPCLDPKIKRLAIQVEDHPYDYADFEGIIPQGQYGGGTVIVWDQGIWSAEHPHKELQQGDITLHLQGDKLNGLWKLVRDKKNPKNWLLFKLNDQYARSLAEYDVTLAMPESVLSGNTIEQVTQKNPNNKIKKTIRTTPKKLKQPQERAGEILRLPKTAMPTAILPQLATLTDKPPTDDEWLHEFKYDGYRLLIFKINNKVKIFTRNQNDWTGKFKSLIESIKKLPVKNLILDGEVVVLDKNQLPNFQLLQNSLKNNQTQEHVFYAFDVLYYDQYNLMKLPLIERKNILSSLLSSNSYKNLFYSDHILGSGKAIFSKACKLSWEGIVSKKIDSIYQQKRSQDWLKVKCIKRQEFLIGGYTAPRGNRRYFGSLLLGTYNKEHTLIYNGHVGTGFNEESLKSIYALLKKHETLKSPFIQHIPKSHKVTWVKPVLIIEVEFSEWTKDNVLRHPSFKGLRVDKKPSKITREKEITLSKLVDKTKSIVSHPNKIVYPELKITKGEVAEYFAFIHKWMLPYVQKRPLTLVRCPDSYKYCFYQKHLSENLPNGLYSVSIKEKNAEDKYIYLNNKTGLIALAQLGVLEIHPWGSKINKIEYPDILIFDLDPADGVPWKDVVKAAFLIKNYLNEVNLTSFVKSTGGKGLHVVVPIKPQFDWQTIKMFAHSFVDFIVKNNPKKYVGTISKTARKGKIFIDYLRNQRGATAVAPYSTRARKAATVATPLDWEELTNNIKDTTFNLKTIYQRMDQLKQDPWAEFFKIKQVLPLKSK